MSLVCGEGSCRKIIQPTDFDVYYQDWDQKIKKSITKLFQVEQPLMPFLDIKTREELDIFYAHPEKYKSIYALRYVKAVEK